ncbi:MAG: hypothetical protein FJZ01_02680 [Candidatus Sericytochromatia bacterium]|nr:hypothetical protein [Candidatus Tanganyikabacteria bacterium]
MKRIDRRGGSRAIRPGACALWLSFTTGCALGAGGAFSRLASESRLTVALPLAAGRLDSAGRWVTNNGYAVTLDGGIRLGKAAVTLVGAGGGTAAAAFDPARPPSGYTSCHSGHCHRSDGALVPYAEVAADLARKAGGVATSSAAVLTFALADLALAAGGEASRSAAACEPCLLGRGTIVGADLAVASLAASGTVEATPGAPSPGAATRSWTLAVGALPLLPGTLSRAIDRDAPSGLVFGGRLALSEKLFDNLEWAGFAATGTIAIDASPSALTSIRANLARSNWQAGFQAGN